MIKKNEQNLFILYCVKVLSIVIENVYKLSEDHILLLFKYFRPFQSFSRTNIVLYVDIFCVPLVNLDNLLIISLSANTIYSDKFILYQGANQLANDIVLEILIKRLKLLIVI